LTLLLSNVLSGTKLPNSKHQIQKKLQIPICKTIKSLTPTIFPNCDARPEKGRIDHQTKGENGVIADYQKFTLEYFGLLAALNKPEINQVKLDWFKLAIMILRCRLKFGN
jgi:hypothetical protein